MGCVHSKEAADGQFLQHSPEVEPKEVVDAQIHPVISQGSFKSEFQSKFVIVNIIGRGTYGCVFEVVNKLDEWKYAVKRIPMRGSEEQKTATAKEARTLASFQHPGIVAYNTSWTEEPPHGWQKGQDQKMLFALNSNAYFDYLDDSSFLYI
ncbi:hypothetical protein PMAYCL1PPCAC_08275 [Pristionchus mayeri]|uniref:Protein kinase domain-containing protein n=1 Tax=Pristionchus mayeri TaxID=1317129 RepID=A0AAN4ZI14_9BILA|nr:hypothetical protein PMAYCL1PPCAC_08275 [Pristionchus mayeri]